MGTYQPTDRPTNQPTDAVSYRGATSRLKNVVSLKNTKPTLENKVLHHGNAVFIDNAFESLH
jgi:hypothetical protein